MSERRRVVPDCSVIVPAYFQEELEVNDNLMDLTQQAIPLVGSIRAGDVIAFAPDLLVHEFLKTAHRKFCGRAESRNLPLEKVQEQMEDFLELPLKYVRMNDKYFAGKAWALMAQGGFSAADSWYLAIAIEYHAELWISHEHQDKFAEKARRVHSPVFTLSTTRYPLLRHRTAG